MKVLHVIPSYKPAYTYGGPVMSVSKLCESLASRVDLTLVTTDANRETTLDVPIGIPVDVDGVTVRYFRRNMGDPHESSLGLWRYLRRNAAGYDVVHIHSWWNLLAMGAAWICTARRVPVVLSPRGMLSDYILRSNNAFIKQWTHRLVGRRVLSRTIFHATSEQEGEECRGLIPGWKGFVIPNLISLPVVPPERRPTQIFTIGFLSRIDPKKGLELLFEALAGVPFPFRLKIAGEGNEAYVQSLKDLAFRKGLYGSIEWLGWISGEEKYRTLASFDVLILPSYNENFANVVVEALYAGTAVCVSDKVGLAEFVLAREMGWVTSLQPLDVRAKIEDAYADAARRAEVRARGRSVVEAHFSEGVLVGRYLDMYRTLRNGFPAAEPVARDSRYISSKAPGIL